LTTTRPWVGFLIENGLIMRAKPGKDRRKAVLSLTAKARSMLDELFSWTKEAQ
jgi:DNA-binding MarR family transcriptional regulator